MQQLQPTISNSSTNIRSSSTGTTNSNSNTSSSMSSPSFNTYLSTPATNKKKQKLHELQIDSKNLTQLCNQFIKENNHLGLALIARQRGIPPVLRHKVWPILLKYHPSVINPFLTSNVDADSDNIVPEGKIKHELMKYFRIRNTHEEETSHNHHIHNDNNSNNNTQSGSISTNSSSSSGISSPDHKTSPLEEEIVRILEHAIIKFFKKWGQIIKYDAGFTWIALGLAEWYPPIPNSDYVLLGRDVLNKEDMISRHLTQLSTQYENETNENDDASTFSLDSPLSTASNADDRASENSSSGTSSMTFAEVYERLVLVLLHSNEQEEEDDVDEVDEDPKSSGKEGENTVDLISSNKLNTMELLFKSGNIDSRISFFLLVFAKLLPELYKGFSEDEIVNSNSNKNNQWLSWWFKYCGAKVLDKYDRGRLWDLIIGFRLSYTNYEAKYFDNVKLLKRFKKFYNEDDFNFDNSYGLQFSSDAFWYKPSPDTKNELKWSQIDYQIELIFVYISILQKNESKLLEFDQEEIKEFLNKVPNDHLKEQKKQQKKQQQQQQQIIPENGANSPQVIIKNTDFFSTDDFDKVLNEAGELWRNWLWNEIREEINE